MSRQAERDSSGEIKPGTRVFAHREIDEESLTIYAYGYGVYEGNFTPKQEPMIGGGVKKLTLNPRIKLDSGQIIWGYECYWIPASEIADILLDFKIVKVDINEDRREAMQLSPN